MKITIIGLVLTLVTGIIHADSGSSISIREVVSELAGSRTGKVVGWERFEGGKEIIPNAILMLKALGKLDTQELEKMISDNTDYECLVGSDSIIIVPKINPSKYTTPLSRITYDVPQVSDASQAELLASLKPYDKTGKHVFLVPSPLVGSQITEGSISVKAQRASGYQILNEMARQLKAQSWIIINGALTVDSGNAKASGPMFLGCGRVSFFANN